MTRYLIAAAAIGGSALVYFGVRFWLRVMAAGG